MNMLKLPAQQREDTQVAASSKAAVARSNLSMLELLAQPLECATSTCSQQWEHTQAAATWVYLSLRLMLRESFAPKGVKYPCTTPAASSSEPGSLKICHRSSGAHSSSCASSSSS
eukprot:CAMPEP_0179128236 /NCGR_PEP_ID=MMETSP0796-20121207/60789_1 /TAXON_ID=73915 /ORGANISM="Pyrodinium bahamense, Strain pbaha01" /LENGTH=114 /DNA_ID=CAMNT_0020827067 /DNA_START=225 /DNA_END=566 /DNA_ORIENTATION=+